MLASGLVVASGRLQQQGRGPDRVLQKAGTMRRIAGSTHVVPRLVHAILAHTSPHLSQLPPLLCVQVRARPNVITSTSGSRDLQMVSRCMAASVCSSTAEGAFVVLPAIAPVAPTGHAKGSTGQRQRGRVVVVVVVCVGGGGRSKAWAVRQGCCGSCAAVCWLRKDRVTPLWGRVTSVHSQLGHCCRHACRHAPALAALALPPPPSHPPAHPTSPPHPPHPPTHPPASPCAR